MYLDKSLISTILAMHQLIKSNGEPNGKYSIKTFMETGVIEYSNNPTEDLYVHDNRNGDHVTRYGHFVPNVRNVVWTDRIAGSETHQPAITAGLTPILSAGDCVCLLKDISDDPDKTHYVADSYVTIPKGHMAFAQPANDQGIGYVVVVQEIK